MLPMRPNLDSFMLNIIPSCPAIIDMVSTCCKFHNIIPIARLYSIIYVAFDMDLHYLTFMRRNLQNKKKLMPVRIMNIVNMNIKNIVNNVGIVNDALINMPFLLMVLLGNNHGMNNDSCT